MIDHECVPTAACTNTSLVACFSNITLSGKSQREPRSLKLNATWLQGFSGKAWFHSTPMSIVISTIYIVALALMIYGSLQLRCQRQLSDIVEPRSSTGQFLDAASRYDLAGAEYTEVTLYISDFGDLRDAAVRERVEELVLSFESSEYTLGKEGTTFWMRPYVEQYARYDSLSQSATWNDELHKWTQMATYHHFADDLAFGIAESNNSCNCVWELVSFKVHFGLTANAFRHCMDTAANIHSIVSRAKGTQMQVIALYPCKSVHESLTSLLKVNTEAMIICSVAVVVLSLLLVNDRLAAVWLIVMVSSTNVFNVGIMGLAGLPVNYVTVLVLLTSVGISIDYSVHIAVAFAHATGDTTEKVFAAMCEAGVPVTKCAFTTFAGCLALSGLQVPAYQEFYYALLTVILVGFVHAVLFFPALILASSAAWNQIAKNTKGTRVCHT